MADPENFEQENDEVDILEAERDELKLIEGYYWKFTFLNYLFNGLFFAIATAWVVHLNAIYGETANQFLSEEILVAALKITVFLSASTLIIPFTSHYFFVFAYKAKIQTISSANNKISKHIQRDEELQMSVENCDKLESRVDSLTGFWNATTVVFLIISLGAGIYLL